MLLSHELRGSQCDIFCSDADFGVVEALVNNASWDRIKWFVGQDASVWDRLIDVNLRGQTNCSRAVADHFVESGTVGPS